MKRNCPKNCWCDCHDRKGITDKQRLDFIEASKNEIQYDRNSYRERWFAGEVWTLTLREAIDAAIRQERKKK